MTSLLTALTDHCFIIGERLDKRNKAYVFYIKRGRTTTEQHVYHAMAPILAFTLRKHYLPCWCSRSLQARGESAFSSLSVFPLQHLFYSLQAVQANNHVGGRDLYLFLEVTTGIESESEIFLFTPAESGTRQEIRIKQLDEFPAPYSWHRQWQKFYSILVNTKIEFNKKTKQLQYCI